ncbi:MAG: GMC family oxidoreductase N-terminal domain-containing protein [Mycobacterium sp.]|nr:GMC family oxidoreductase N-terminal domain-containing protein [Mycobacterium sp.]
MIADFVVVGTGSAGAVLADRLSADGTTQVVVLEAGAADNNQFIHIPAAFSKLFRSEFDWDYSTEPQPELADRRIFWPRGKTLGGSSSMNAMMWVRGLPADYDEWGELAGEDWSYAAVQQRLDRIEDGPLALNQQRSPRSITGAWLEAAEQCGHRGFVQTTVCQRRGARWSTADAYLRPALRRTNLHLRTGATATRVLFEGNRAIGVEYESDGRRHTVMARREVVLCGGAINSPQLLMLSGIGPREHLVEHGIDVVRDVPEVGANLLDHLLVVLGFDANCDTLTGAEKPAQLLNYLTRRRGMLTSNVGEAYGFMRSQADLDQPDVELIFAPAPFFDEGIGEPYPRDAVTMGPILVKPKSTGTIRLASADPLAKPIIDPRYLSDPEGADRQALLAGLRAVAEIAQAPALKGLLGGIARPIGGRELDDATLELALATTSHTLYHPTTTCRMGSDEGSVVDPQLRVRGVDGLRVADASVMPTIIRGHTHAPSVLIGEKAADYLTTS